MRIKPPFTSILIMFFALITAPLSYGNDIEDVLNSKERPAGVVFEIVSNNADELRNAIPAVRGYINTLRKRFPKLDVAVVSHGKEQFALTTNNKKEYSKVHSEIKSLVKDAGVPVHVCETYASWFNIEASAFPDYVDVSPTGPAQINDYLALDYTLVVIE